MKTYLVWLKFGTCSYVDADEVEQDERTYRFIREGEVVAQYSCKWIDRISDTRSVQAMPGERREESRQQEA